jgi:Rrf2 family transcriptional regulator, cysteine metabolism repressor
MRVSSRVDYGVRALFDLAQRFGQGPVQSRDIANRQQVPEAYLHQVLGALGRAGLVRSTRGPLGGHELTREPKDVTLWDVLLVLDGPERKLHPHDAVTDADPVHEVWHDLQAQTTALLQGITLEALVERALAARPPENYSI